MRLVAACAAVLALVPLVLQAHATVIELNADNYTRYLIGLSGEDNVAIEYYANWCPHCKKFAPSYELVGSHFMDVDVPQVNVARIDCATNVRSPLSSPRGSSHDRWLAALSPEVYVPLLQ